VGNSTPEFTPYIDTGLKMEVRKMTTKVDEIISMAESLPVDIKTTLVEKILNSLHPSQKEIDALWAKEVEKRVNEIKTGKVKTIPGDEVFKEIQGKLYR